MRMKKIVYVMKSFAVKAGVERVMSDKMNYLAGQGYEVVMVTYEQGQHPDAFPLHPAIRHLDLGVPFFPIMKYGLLKRLPKIRRLRQLFKARLQALLDAEQPDVLIVSTCSIKLMDIVLSAKTRARKMIESHAPCYAVKKSVYYQDRPLLRMLAVLYDKWMLGQAAKADLLVTLTEGDAREWRSYIPRIEVIPNPVTKYPDVVKPHDASGHRIICAGRLNKEKRFDLLIDAFARIAADCPEWTVDIFGEGADQPMLLDRINQYGLADRIIIHEPTADIYSEYQDSEFYALSSLYEGFGLVLVEAMSCGIPCVAFRCKYGPEDIIADRQDGLLVEDGNVVALADAMLWMIRHPEERLRMGKAAREAVARYQKPVVMQRWMDLFEKSE